MKKLIYIGMMCVFALTAFAQEPEQIDLGPYGGTIVIGNNKKQTEYFETQIKLWEKKVKQDKKDANAWLNYFAATKSAYQMEVTNLMENVKNGLGVDMSDSKYKYAQIAEEAYKHLPNSFEANYMMHFRNNFFMKANYDYLLKAQEIKPFDQRIIIPLFRYYELIQDLTNAKIIAHEIAKQKTLNEIDYATAYNILMELEENAVLITNGYNEYLACLVLQKLKSIKPNVLITTNYIINPGNNFASENSDKTLNRIGLKSVRYPEVEETNNKKFNWENSIKEYEEREKKNFELIFNSNNPIYILNNTIRQYQELFGDKLYIHGLTYRYSKQPVNYIYNIKENYEKNYSLDYIKHDISPAPSDNYEQSMYYMYYPSALKLYEFYKEKGPYEQQQEMKKFIQILAEKSGKDFFKNNDIFKENEIVTYSRAEIDFKKLQASFVALNAVEHIGKFEVTNGEYNLFLKNLKKTKNYELYYECMIDSTRWSSIFPTAYHDPMIDFYHHHPAYANYPIVNIPYEGAVAYCKWLTVQYNQQHPEGKYVSFRLPSEQEWRYAAGSKNEKAITSFPNDNILTSNPNIKELKALGKFTKDGVSIPICYLGNIKTDSGYQADGGFHTTTVTSYPPNALGIYNTFGNVAEMTSTKGIIKGGSWADLFSECTFDKNATYSAPDPRVGFRIMMVIVPDINDLPILTAKIAPNLGVDKSEITYFNWLEFLQYQKQHYGEHSPEYRDNLPDTTLVKQGECENYNALPYTHQAFRDIPIIGITQKQAKNYSIWRSNQVFEIFLLEKGYLKQIENSPKEDFTIEKYYNNELINYAYNKNEKYPFYPCYSIPNIEEYKLINKLANDINNVKIKPKTIKMKIEIDTMSICDLTQFSTIINLENKNDIYFLESGIAEWTDDIGKVINGSIEISEDRKAGEVLDANQLKYIGFRNKVEWQPWNPNQTK